MPDELDQLLKSSGVTAPAAAAGSGGGSPFGRR